MKWFEWFIAIVLVGLGLMCLTLSAMPRLHADIMGFIRTMVQLCFWMGLPVLLIGIIYMIFLFFKNRNH